MDLFLIFIITTFCHFKLFFGATTHVDSWILNSWLDSDSPEMKRFFRYVSMPLMSRLHSLIGKRKYSEYLYGFSTLIALYIGNFSVFYILHSAFQLDYRGSLLITSLYCTYAGNSLIIDKVIGLQYYSIYNFYLFSIALLFWGSTSDGPIGIITIVSSLLITCLCFNTKSLLVIHFPYVYLFYITQSQNASNYFRVNILTILEVIIPFLVWFLYAFYFPPSGPYKGYNSFISITKKNIALLIIRIGEALKHGLILPTTEAFQILFKSKLAFPSIIIIIHLNGINILKIPMEQELPGLNLAWLAALFAVSAVFPYAVVNQEFDSTGYLTKNNLLLGVPYAFITFQLSKVFFPSNPESFMLLLIFSGAIKINSDHSKAIFDYIKNLAFIYEFKKRFPSQLKSYIVIYDHTSYKLLGKKSRLYPMSLYYMLNEDPTNPRFLAASEIKQEQMTPLNLCKISQDCELPLNKEPFKQFKDAIFLVHIEDFCSQTPMQLWKLYLKFRYSQIRNISMPDLHIVKLRIKEQKTRNTNLK